MSSLFQDSPGNTPLSEEELQGLIPALATKHELNEWERENILQARRWALAPRQIKTCDPLSEPFIRKLHEKMFDETWKWAGTYRNTEKNIGLRVIQIREGIANLIEDAKYWIADKMPFDEVAARFHHRLVYIHPFPNGNGRHARLLSDILLIKNGHPEFDWGRSDLGPKGDIRARYIAALQAADGGNISDLLKFARSTPPL
jgi:Fic-DOC domain mobile mystery protein B